MVYCVKMSTTVKTYFYNVPNVSGNCPVKSMPTFPMVVVKTKHTFHHDLVAMLYV